MALGKRAKQDEPKEQKSEKRQPDFIIRAKQPRRPGDDRQFWLTIGAAFSAEWKDKDTGDTVQGYSVKINNAPLGWDGDCLMMPPKEEGER